MSGMRFSAAFSEAFAGRALPYVWYCFALPDEKICTLLAQLALVRGESYDYRSDGGLVVAGRQLIGPAGKIYRFASQATAEWWVSIALERARRELELAKAMDGARRAAWLVGKRARLEARADGMVERARSIADGDTRNALVSDAGFALVKWAHYG